MADIEQLRAEAENLRRKIRVSSWSYYLLMVGGVDSTHTDIAS